MTPIVTLNVDHVPVGVLVELGEACRPLAPTGKVYVTAIDGHVAVVTDPPERPQLSEEELEDDDLIAAWDTHHGIVRDVAVALATSRPHVIRHARRLGLLNGVSA